MHFRDVHMISAALQMSFFLDGGAYKEKSLVVLKHVPDTLGTLKMRLQCAFIDLNRGFW